MKTAFERKLHGVWRRSQANLLLDQLGWLLAAAGAALALAIAGERIFGGGWFRLWMLPALLAAVLAGAGVRWYLRRPTLMDAALLADERLNTRERFSTCLALADDPSPFAAAARAQAQRLAAGLETAGKFPVRWGRRWLWTLAAWLSAGGVAVLLPALDVWGLMHKKQAQQAQLQQLQQAQAQVKEAARKVDVAIRQLKDPDLSQEAAGLADLKEGLQADDVKRQAIKKLDDLSEKLAQSLKSEKLEGAKELREMLKGLKGSPQQASAELNRALAKGDFKGAADALKDLQRQLDEGKLPPEQKEALEKQIADLSQQLQELAARGGNGLEEELEKQGLNKDLAEKLKELADKQEQAESAQTEQEKKQAREELKKLAEELQKKGLSKEQIEQLRKQAAAGKLASAKLRELGQKCQSCSGDGEISPNELGEMLGELGELGAAGEDLAAREEAVKELELAANKLGQCSGGACAGAGAGGGEQEDNGRPGGAGEGAGGAQPGIGGGGDQENNARPGGSRAGRGTARHAPPPSDAKVDYEKTRTASQVREGPSIASWYFKGEQVTGEAKKEFKDVVQAGKDSAAEALNDNEIPRKYEGPIKDYFGKLENAKKPKEPPK